ncbi:MAG: LPS export ABC transporter periplasmic protein LptC [Pseudomonadaceae bacterium]|uniref:Lipopolysaccharide export system protein LptC n=1 Tax=Pseudomonas marincola TaxID=437900 RepID=A0A653DZG5_9PSED|nr:LPS export ABC transporter periplasmic protein LptC [Pseudomonas marincola]MBQ55536.1 LPS export ABC transporter periplasmic protein LptC [Pseudomonadaceae bacterium]CAE6941927.1 Lipopolysaccharide export system protein LptC [Pseudomonas marincola]HCP56744.1 LPS export ABC transporter periplasmic protein LptC [Pseudomonas sp.]
MPNPRKLLSLLLYAIGAALLVAVGYWNINQETFSDRQPASTTDSPIDFYVVNTSTVQYMPDGSRHYTLKADKLEHFKATDITNVTLPNLMLYRGTEYPWHVRSEKGEIGPGGQEVELIDKVKVERTDAKGRPTILNTSRLTVFPDKQYAQTEQAVRIDAANGVTTAVGMKAYLDDSRMLLLSKVRGQHEVR